MAWILATGTRAISAGPAASFQRWGVTRLTRLSVHWADNTTATSSVFNPSWLLAQAKKKLVSGVMPKGGWYFDAIITADEQRQLTDVNRRIAEVDRELKAVPPLRQVWAGRFNQPSTLSSATRSSARSSSAQSEAAR